MAFHHLAGTTTLSAPDEVADWFATFEAWIRDTVGWTVVSGAGTTDLVLSSPGEGGTYTKLFVHIWRDLVESSHVHGEIQDDAPGTHVTSAGTYVDSNGDQFNYWMSADLEAIFIAWKYMGDYRIMYEGTVWPYALSPADETYYMISASRLGLSNVLRRYDGVWDSVNNNHSMSISDNMRRSPYDGGFPLMGILAGWRNETVGQLRHISGVIADGSVSLEETLATGYPGATTTWVVMSDHEEKKFAVRTGGVLPTGVADGAHFASTSGVTTSPSHFLGTVLPAFLAGIGWTDLGDPGGPEDVNRLFYSPGESGTEDIYVLIGWSDEAHDYWRIYVQDDAVGTHRTSEVHSVMEIWDFPANYLVSADRDCIAFSTQNSLGNFPVHWAGMVVPFNPNLPSSPYRMATYCSASAKYQQCRVLRNAAGEWSKSAYMTDRPSPALPGYITDSNGNLYDGVTYIVWPMSVNVWLPGYGVPRDGYGMMKYAFTTDGAAASQMDTISVGAKVYTVLEWQATWLWALRTT